MKLIFFLILSIPTILCASEEDLFGEGIQDSSTQPSQSLNVIFSGTIDFRFDQSGSSVSWEDGGRGITNTSGQSDGRRSIKMNLPRVAIATDVLHNNELIGFIQWNWDDHSSFGTETHSMVYSKPLLINKSIKTITFEPAL